MSSTRIRFFVVLFFLWHAFAIGIYSFKHPLAQSLPATNPVIRFVDTQLYPLVRPYLLVTSQWQRWNLFAPDPLRRMSKLEVQIYDSAKQEWKSLKTIDADHINWWHHAIMLKTIRRMGSNDGYAPARNRLLKFYCGNADPSQEQSVRLRQMSAVLPYVGNHTSPTWWRRYAPEWNESILLTTTCPAST